MVTIKLFSQASTKIIPDLEKDIAKNILPPKREDIIIPKTQHRELERSNEQIDFYDAGYMEKFFEAARKAEAEAFRKMQEEENNYFKEFEKYEEEMYEKYK